MKIQPAIHYRTWRYAALLPPTLAIRLRLLSQGTTPTDYGLNAIFAKEKQ